MPNGRISKRSVDALVCPPGKDRVALWDDDLAGFGIVAFLSGLKSYVVQYRQITALTYAADLISLSSNISASAEESYACETEYLTYSLRTSLIGCDLW